MMKASGVAKIGKATLPDKMVSAIEECGFFESIPLWAVTLIGSLFKGIIDKDIMQSKDIRRPRSSIVECVWVKSMLYGRKI